MALARVDRPAVVLSAARCSRAATEDRRSPSRTCGRRSARTTAAGFTRRARPWIARPAPAPATAPEFTANTMAIVVDMLGLGMIGDGLIPAAFTQEKDAAAERAGALAVKLAEQAPPPGASWTAARSRTRWRARWPPAARPRLPPPVGDRAEAGFPLTLEELAAVSASTPVLADLVPGGRLVASDLHTAGGRRR